MNLQREACLPAETESKTVAAKSNPVGFQAFTIEIEIEIVGLIQRSRPVADIEQGHVSSASCILANIAMKVGRALVYDPAKREVVGDPQATALLRRTYRGPWRHHEPSDYLS